ncbi:tRNA glutamyl-Q(34) synthetase GluQRS [Ponticaulis profundi]|uniref:tRNA glutamyl-Q(34) synthetase GluQRS n=1 Tax=Ponticaulis profundi TaxID=2665222 RepID=A0ABW1S730_9PROT
MSSSFLTRFAPSPTGYLHLGHAYAAYQAFEAARRADGTCLLRIEDIDQTRCRPEYTDAIYEDLAWLGFDWPRPVRVQSEHFIAYESALARLEQIGVVYRCFLTRKELKAELEKRGIAESPVGERPYPGPERVMTEDETQARLQAGQPFAWRLSLSRCRDLLGTAWQALSFRETGNAEGLSQGEVKARPEWLGDVVLARKDTPTSYHLACTHDDALQNISTVVRGVDLYHATHIHVLLQYLLGWQQPTYCHHRLVLGADGKKFSKSDRSKTIRAFRSEGISPADMLRDWIKV